MSLTFRAHVQLTLGDLAAAMAALEEAIVLLRELDPTDQVVLQRVLLAVALTWHGNREQARTELRKLVAPGKGPSSARYQVLARIYLGNLARYDGALAEAGHEYDAAWADLERVSFDAPLFRAMLLCALAQLAVARKDTATALDRLAEAFTIAAAPMYVPILAEIGVAVAAVRLTEGDAELAAQVLGAAYTLHGAPDSFHPDVVTVHRRLNEVLGEGAHTIAYDRGRSLDRAGTLALIEDQVLRRR